MKTIEEYIEEAKALKDAIEEAPETGNTRYKHSLILHRQCLIDMLETHPDLERVVTEHKKDDAEFMTDFLMAKELSKRFAARHANTDRYGDNPIGYGVQVMLILGIREIVGETVSDIA